MTDLDMNKASDMARALAELLIAETERNKASRAELVAAATILLVSLADAAHYPEEVALEAVSACFRDVRRGMAKAAVNAN